MKKKLRRIIILGVVLVFLIWLNSFLLDGIFGEIGCFLLGDDAEYSSGYTATKFKKIKPGMKEEEVLTLLGQPLLKRYIDYTDNFDYIYVTIDQETNKSSVSRISEEHSEKIKMGMTEGEVLKILGKKGETIWHYSISRNDTHYRNRGLIFKNGEVVRKFHEFYWD